MATSGDLPANHTTNVSKTATRLISRQARRGTPSVVSVPPSGLHPPLPQGPVFVIGSTDRAGQVILWDIPPGGGTCTVTYANPYQPPAPVVGICPTSSTIVAAEEEEIYISARSTTGFSVSKANALGGTLNTVGFNYHVVETGFINPSSTKLT